jgi:glutaredoxin
MKQILLAAILMALLGVGCNRNEQPTAATDLPKDQMILFVGQDCPHCEIVKNKLKSDYPKLPIMIKEVYNDGQNAALLIKAIKTCGLSFDTAGVPLLWDGKACHEGDGSILQYLKDLN